MTDDRTPSPSSLPPGAAIHLVGIGGAGMSALATILLERGHPVSGSDLRGGRAAAALQALGAKVHVGHDADHVGDASVVVVSTAVPASNAELQAARERGLPVLHRAELLAALMAGYRRLLVAGTHGKTTTTSMATVALQAAGMDPSFAIGGTLHDSGTSAHHGTGDVFVAEADESDRSLLRLVPDCAVLTNVELDHHDAYADVEEVREVFATFLERRPAAAPAIVCSDDEGVRALLPRIGGRVLTYGEGGDADVRLVDLSLTPSGSRFRVVAEGADLGPFTLRLTGRHVALNATAAVAAAIWAGANPDDVRVGLSTFLGAHRRFQRLGEAGGVTVVDDYGHHPTELAATLAAARQLQPAGRVVAVFQPHRYSRTQALGAELGHALAAADLVVVTDVYAAGEAPVPGVNGALVAEAAAATGTPTTFVAATGDVPAEVARLVAPGDLVVTLGAGDITDVGPALLDLLEAAHGR